MKSIGVIVARLQVSKLTNGHRALFDTVLKAHNNVLLLLGTTDTVSSKNPLDFISRRKMMQEAYPDITVLPIEDKPSDKAWSENLDSIVRGAFPMGQVKLYGGRDSFINHYVGKFDTQDLSDLLKDSSEWSGTMERENVADNPLSSSDFRAGVIYGITNNWPRINPVVDIACIKHPTEEEYQQHNIDSKKDKPYTKYVLMGQKEGEEKWRFPGGFVDISDESLEGAALRELREECGSFETKNIRYISSGKVPSYRTRGIKDICLYSTFFAVDYNYGPTKAGDDLVNVKWLPLCRETLDVVIDSHREMFENLLISEGIL